MRRSVTIYLAVLSVAAAMSIVAQEATPQAQRASATTAATTARPARATAKTSPAAVVQDPAQYVGEDTCLTCHEGQKYDRTAHALKSNGRTPAATHGCESCHGPGKAHVDGSGDTTKIIRLKAISPQESSASCTGCHDRRTHALWAGSQHDQRNVGCVTCHSVHAPKGPKQLVAATEAQVCATCHRSVVNKQHRFNHMPVREGALTCSSCHNTHGSVNLRLLKTGTTIDESCASCHAEKRGPYLWEHAPVANACVTCHEPHGSNNDRMLVAKLPYLCQRCHVTSRHPPTVYEGFLLKNSTNGNKIFGRSCVVCHQQIHGSNAPSGQMFLR
jgi:DmsE family decaheme c-type cytochrome